MWRGMPGIVRCSLDVIDARNALGKLNRDGFAQHDHTGVAQALCHRAILFTDIVAQGA